MNNLSTAASTDINSQIGALELSDRLASHDDGALLRAVTNEGPTASPGNCTNWPTGRCWAPAEFERA
jgi:hypothetical protein